jgi:hypothetical protein
MRRSHGPNFGVAQHGQILPGPEKSLLCNILSFKSVAEEDAGKPISRALVAPDQLAVGFPVSSLGRCYEIGVGSCVHSLLTG